MRNHRILALAALIVTAASLIAAPPVHKPSRPAAPGKAAAEPQPNAPLLPAAFAGWEGVLPAKSVADPTAADPASAAALKEYGLTDALLADYSRSGQTLKIKALRFIDASGAYGAYSFYRHNSWPKVEAGAGGASDNNRVLFWVGNVVVDAQFQQITAMSGAELRELAATIPRPAGNKSLPPPILGNLPQKNLDPQTTHYALGPAGYAGSGGVLPPQLIGFDRGAETATATYALLSNPATLTVINYPTPQMAAAQATVIANYLKAGDSPEHPFTEALKESNPQALEVRRSGPLVAIVSGDAIQSEALSLLSLVHFEAETSAIPGGGAVNPAQNFARLILGIIGLVAVMFISALCVALFLGGGRAAFRVMRGKPASSMYDEDFTRLDLHD
jgi:hypothetical protein